MAKSILKLQAQKLRSKGKSLNEIARILKISKSTASLWCKNVILTSEQTETLKNQARDPHYGNRLLNIQKQRTKRLSRINECYLEGISRIGTITDRELFVAGAALYWAEGFKKDNQVGFANTDPNMINFFLKWLFRCFGYSTEDITIRIAANISHKDRITDIEQFWVKTTGIPTQNFKKPFFQNVAWKKHYTHPENYYGVARIRVRKSTDFLRTIHGFIEGMKQSSLTQTN